MSRMRGAITSEHLERLALFPLPNTVFFPHTILPLHIFEPRYRELTREALVTGIPIAVVLAYPEGRLDSEGRPAVHAVAGVGEIVDHERLADGRYNILLHGLGRVRILEEVRSNRSFRQARAGWIDEVRPSDEDGAARLLTLRNTIVTLHRMHPDIGVPLLKMAHQVDDADALVDIMASVLFPEIHLRQRLLEEARFVKRYKAILGRITDLLVEGADEPPSGALN